jgi:hypothetical protein
MAKSSHDDLADALARMAGGETASSEEEPAVESHAEPSPPPAPVKQRAPAKVPVKAATPSPPRLSPVAPAPRQPVARQTAPVPSPAPIKASRPAAPARPAAPVLPKPVQPAPQMDEPSLSNEAEPAGSTGDGSDDQPAIFDDDSVIVPAPDAAVFAPRPKSAAALKAHRTAVYQTVEFRRTMIPVLLTCGVLMLVFAVLKFLARADSPLADLPMWLPVVLIITAIALLGLGVLNMLSVQNSLAAIDPPKQPR